ncbi:hypothetical protein R7W29_004132 [Citrobacter freundii]|nr:hypothetical protein [Citrobacter freundii]
MTDTSTEVVPQQEVQAQKERKPNPIAAIEKFVEVQTKEIELKEKELDFKTHELEIRRQEIESNKEIALKSIDAQKEDRATQATIFSGVETKKVYFKYIVTIAVAVVVIVSMYTGNAQYAIELAKIGGGVLAGWLAGVYKGKSDQLELARHKKAKINPATAPGFYCPFLTNSAASLSNPLWITFPTALRLASSWSTIASRSITTPSIINSTTAPPISPAMKAARSSSNSSRDISIPKPIAIPCLVFF